MMNRRFPIRPALGLLALALVAGCGGGDDNLAELDNQLLANGADPALTSALEDQILVDPNLVQQANPNTVRPPETPVQAQYPAGSASEGATPATARLGSAAITAGPEPTACGRPFEFGAGWARRLPADFMPYPGGRLVEAAGVDAGACSARVVTFRTDLGAPSVLDHYRTLATRAGYSAEQQVRGSDTVLAGVNATTDGAFFLIVTPAEAGSEVALIVNNGR